MTRLADPSGRSNNSSGRRDAESNSRSIATLMEHCDDGRFEFNEGDRDRIEELEKSIARVSLPTTDIPMS
jgi:hypothetical protein